MKKTINFIFVLFLTGNIFAQTDFMPVGSVVRAEGYCYGFEGREILTSQKDTLCSGEPCRKVIISYESNRNSRVFEENIFFIQKGDSIFEYSADPRRREFLFKNRYNVGDSIKLTQTIIGSTTNVVVTRAVVYVDSLIEKNGVKRYACRIKCLPISVSLGDTVEFNRFNLYDKFIPDYNWELYAICQDRFNDGFRYFPLCYTDKSTDYRTPRYVSSCDSTNYLSRPIVQEQPKWDLSIFPNPANTFLRVKSFPSQNIKLSVFDIRGVLVFQKMISTTFDVDIKNLADGIYILKVENEGATITQKLIVHH